MELLTPNCDQAKPTGEEVREMARRIPLTPVSLPKEPFDKFLHTVRTSHDNGGAYLASFEVGLDPVFDWFASRNRLWEERLLDCLTLHPVIVRTLPELLIPSTSTGGNGFGMYDHFLFDGMLTSILYHGGAYSHAQGDGQAEKALALEVCKAMFGLRYGEITCNLNYDPWTPWFKGIAWDLTALVFDRRLRRLWILAITDTD